MKPKDFEFLVDALKSLPTISQKNANKIAYFLLSVDNKFFNDFIERILNFKKNIRYCELCNNLVTNNLICDICKSESREQKKLCIVSFHEDFEKIENSNSFHGKYFILNCEINQKDLTTSKNIDLEKLEKIINYFEIDEILIATNMTANGEITGNYIKKFILDKKFNIEIFRLALGIPINSSIDYID